MMNCFFVIWWHGFGVQVKSSQPLIIPIYSDPNSFVLCGYSDSNVYAYSGPNRHYTFFHPNDFVLDEGFVSAAQFTGFSLPIPLNLVWLIRIFDIEQLLLVFVRVEQ